MLPAALDPRRPKHPVKLLITGIAGFIGRNAAEHFLGRGDFVVGVDSLCRKGSRESLQQIRHHPRLHFEQLDVGDAEAVDQVVRQQAGLEAVLHLAGQVAVTTSVARPREDLESNLLGTFNMLEALRKHRPQAAFVNASTNKVYGGLSQVPVVERNGRYEYADRPFGISEEQPLDFCSPYGCSKGAADQYVLDYARIYGMRTVSFRQSCIYGQNQFGVTDQGWVAWFVIAAAAGRPITIHGDGKQIRDLLHVQDLIRLYELAVARMDSIKGQCFNVGGGPANTLSLLELISFLEEHTGRKLLLHGADWRPGDQKVFVADIRKVERVLGWKPAIRIPEGLEWLCGWVGQNLGLCRKILGI